MGKRGRRRAGPRPVKPAPPEEESSLLKGQRDPGMRAVIQSMSDTLRSRYGNGDCTHESDQPCRNPGPRHGPMQ
jgi:hypothetical protein